MARSTWLPPAVTGTYPTRIFRYIELSPCRLRRCRSTPTLGTECPSNISRLYLDPDTCCRQICLIGKVLKLRYNSLPPDDRPDLETDHTLKGRFEGWSHQLYLTLIELDDRMSLSVWVGSIVPARFVASFNIALIWFWQFWYITWLLFYLLSGA